MAKKFYHDIDLVNIGQILNARKQNITTADRDALALTLGADNEGLSVWDTDLKVGFTWSGTEFIRDTLDVDLTGNILFKGTVDASISLDDDGFGTPQAEAVTGYQYVVATGGTLSMTGVTFSPTTTVEAGDVVLFIDDSNAYVQEGNRDQATETDLGLVKLASEAEALAGTDALKAITAATLKAMVDDFYASQSRVEQHFATVSLTADTPQTITHNLNLVDRDAFTITVMHGNSMISVEVDSVDANSLTVTSAVALTDAKVTVQGKTA